MVAAYLNESALPVTFPGQVGGWNDPTEPGFCPLP
jgi:hypothetical protein